MKLLQAHGNHTTQRIRLQGNPKNPEPEEFYIDFPGGSIGVCRCSDGSYWAHICREERDDQFIDHKDKAIGFDDARIDCRGLHASEMDIGHLSRNDCYHIAVKVITQT